MLAPGVYGSFIQAEFNADMVRDEVIPLIDARFF